jgi:uncharacterized membrane protein
MKTIAQFVRTTILGGVFFLAPIVALIVILAKALEYAKTGLHAVVVHIPGVSDLSVGVATALSIARIALVCLLAGLLAHTVFAQRLVNALESSVLSKIPAYEYLKQESASALGVAEIGELPVVFVPMEGGWQLGVQTEALSNGLVSIFVPGAPIPHSGSFFSFRRTLFGLRASSSPLGSTASGDAARAHPLLAPIGQPGQRTPRCESGALDPAALAVCQFVELLTLHRCATAACSTS